MYRYSGAHRSLLPPPSLVSVIAAQKFEGSWIIPMMPCIFSFLVVPALGLALLLIKLQCPRTPTLTHTSIRSPDQVTKQSMGNVVMNTKDDGPSSLTPAGI